MCKIMLNSVDRVKKFVNETTKVDGDIFLQSDRYLVDAKSIMGIFSLDLTNPLKINFEKCSDEEKNQYLARIHQFIVNG